MRIYESGVFVAYFLFDLGKLLCAVRA